MQSDQADDKTRDAEKPRYNDARDGGCSDDVVGGHSNHRDSA